MLISEEVQVCTVVYEKVVGQMERHEAASRTDFVGCQASKPDHIWVQQFVITSRRRQAHWLIGECIGHISR